jgi:hypothetical protein
MKAQHQQAEVDRSQTLTEFIKEDEVKLKRGERYYLTDIAANTTRLTGKRYFIFIGFVILVYIYLWMR